MLSHNPWTPSAGTEDRLSDRAGLTLRPGALVTAASEMGGRHGPPCELVPWTPASPGLRPACFSPCHACLIAPAQAPLSSSFGITAHLFQVSHERPSCFPEPVPICKVTACLWPVSLLSVESTPCQEAPALGMWTNHFLCPPSSRGFPVWYFLMSCV